MLQARATCHTVRPRPTAVMRAPLLHQPTTVPRHLGTTTAELPRPQSAMSQTRHCVVARQSRSSTAGHAETSKLCLAVTFLHRRSTARPFPLPACGPLVPCTPSGERGPPFRGGEGQAPALNMGLCSSVYAQEEGSVKCVVGRGRLQAHELTSQALGGCQGAAGPHAGGRGQP